MGNNRIERLIVEELTGAKIDNATIAEKLADHLNKLKKINDKILEDDYDQEKADTEQEFVKAYTSWIAIDTLERNGYKEVDGEWIRE